jgi:hypothetical protein
VSQDKYLTLNTLNFKQQRHDWQVVFPFLGEFSLFHGVDRICPFYDVWNASESQAAMGATRV